MKILKDGILVLFYLILFLLLTKLSPFIMTALMLGVYLSIIVDFVARFFARFLHGKISRILANVTVLGVIAYSIGNFFPVIINEAKKVFSEIEKIQITFEDVSIPDWILSFLTNLGKSFSDIALTIVNKLLGYVPSLITALVIVVITTLIVGNLKKVVSKKLDKLFPENPEKGIYFAKTTYREFERFVAGQVLVAAFVGFFVGVMSLIFKIPSAIFLGVLAFITDFIPYLGVIISAIPLLMLGFASHGLKGLIIGVLILLSANQLEMWFLAPKIQSNALKIHWFFILIAILLFGDVIGFGGIFVALPTLIYVKNFWNQYVSKSPH
ncbi:MULTISPECIES: AI-2E family transporter [Pseudothermotoga]|uniref:AI-2E family transporter n=1 Tax=Pseudothermotoga TaxID=1643951 RepID=UPI000321AA01|nr:MULTISPECIES: AI-2E family transporter [Pseudothermotoga]